MFTGSNQISKVFSLESGAFEMEMLALKADVFLKVWVTEKDFWKLVNSEYRKVKKCAENVLSCFG